MRVPISSSGLNVSKAARDQKKKEVARNQRVKKNPRIERILVNIVYRGNMDMSKVRYRYMKSW